MGRKLLRDLAIYFGVGDDPAASERGDPMWVRTVFIVVPVLFAAYALRHAFGFDDDLVGSLVMLGLVAVLGFAAGMVFRARRH